MAVSGNRGQRPDSLVAGSCGTDTYHEPNRNGNEFATHLPCEGFQFDGAVTSFTRRIVFVGTRSGSSQDFV